MLSVGRPRTVLTTVGKFRATHIGNRKNPCGAIAWCRSLRKLAGASLVLLFVVASLGACSSTVTDNLPPIPPTPNPQAGTIPDLPPYKVQVGDLLDIRLFLNSELNEEVVVRPDGMFSTTLAEDIPAYGHTPSQISDELRERYKATLKNPKITVVVHTFAPNRIYVGGEVVNPGEFITVGPNLTISQAIARAGGVKLSADRARIFVLRRGPNDKPEVFSVAYKDVISAKNPAADARLAPYDVLYVPKTGVSEVYTFWNQFVQQFVPLNWGFTYAINPPTAGSSTAGH
jgi:protein involved in polysaccharide export with SLBB domain